MEEKKPIFLIGAQKSGSTYLFRILAHDPLVAQADLKEPKIFSKPCNDGSDFFSFFKPNSDQTCAIDASTSYLHVQGCAERVAARFGTDIPIAAVLRDPIERAQSAYLHEVKHGRETRPPGEVFNHPFDSLAEIIQSEDDRIKRAWHAGLLPPHGAPSERYKDPLFQFRYIANSCYSMQLVPWIERFPKLRLVEFSELRSNPDKVAYLTRAHFSLDTYITVPQNAPRNSTKLSAIKAWIENRNLHYDHYRPGSLKVLYKINKLINSYNQKKPHVNNSLAQLLKNDYEELHQRKNLWL